uniref:EamA domain-containing protein n=1 Tax=Syphacia muris TaxID=451379 RepID=A0A0N5AE76_9BILA
MYDQPGTCKLCLPALLYVTQNILYYIALSNMEAATFCLTYQLITPTTAIMLHIVLDKRLSNKQWLSLVLLTVGIVSVQIQNQWSKTTNSSTDDDPILHDHPSLGLSSIVIMCFASGFADGPLRGFDTTVWITTLINSIGSLLIPIVIKYADSMLKVFIQSTTITGTALGSYITFNFSPNFLYYFGAAAVILSTHIYNTSPYKQKKFDKTGEISTVTC